MALSGQSDATALFLAVRYTPCDTYIDFPQSVIPESRFSEI
jgi:hypothetical protein